MANPNLLSEISIWSTYLIVINVDAEKKHGHAMEISMYIYIHIKCCPKPDAPHGKIDIIYV